MINERRGLSLVCSRLTVISCFVSWTLFKKQNCSNLSSLTQLVKSNSYHYLQANKKHSSLVECFFWSGRRGCLDLFALNVPTVFASKNFILFAKDLRTPLTGRSCLVRSRLTAIPHFAFWTLSNRKSTPAVF